MAQHNWLKCGRIGCMHCAKVTTGSVLVASDAFCLVVVERAPTFAHEVHEMSSPSLVYDFIKSRYVNAEQESFLCLALNSRNKIRVIHEVSRGIATASLVHPREFFRPALMIGAAAAIAVHNHPSGDPTPSRDDDGVTDRLVKAGDLLGITLLDHIVIGNPAAGYPAYHSYRERGSINNLGALGRAVTG